MGTYGTTYQRGSPMSQTLETPAPADIPVPKWAVKVGEWIEDEGLTYREILGRDHVPHPCRVPNAEPFDGVVRLSDWQVSDERPHGACVQFDFGPGLPAEMTAESARSLAQALIEAADELEGPSPAEIRRRVGELQAHVVRAVRGHLARLDMHQDQLAITAGYGMDEMSALMTGRRVLDVIDVWRIAGALQVDPAELFGPDADEQ